MKDIFNQLFEKYFQENNIKKSIFETKFRKEKYIYKINIYTIY